MPVPLAPAVPTVLTVASSKPDPPYVSIRSVLPGNQIELPLAVTAATLMLVSPTAAGADSVVAVEAPALPLESIAVATMLLNVLLSSMATGWPISKIPAVCDALSLLPFATNNFVLPELTGKVRVVAETPEGEFDPPPAEE